MAKVRPKKVERVNKPIPPLVEASLRAFESAIGGREVLVAALAHAPKSKDVEYVLGLIGDPTNRFLSLAELCATGGITVGELIEGFKAGELNRAQAEATRAIGQSLAGVVADTMKLAAPYEDDCYGCLGTGTRVPEPTEEEPNPGPGPCSLCTGTGRLRFEGDLEHKKLALELGKLTSKGSGVSLQVSQTNNHLHLGAAGGALEKLQEATDRILYGGDTPSPVAQLEAGEVVEGEVEPGLPPATLDTDAEGHPL
jgi:hypothetical protein